MSIKSDRWIKEMAINHEMIKPFELSQVRLGKNEEKLMLDTILLIIMLIALFITVRFCIYGDE